jgi:uracil-DNA glycosylase family 4
MERGSGWGDSSVVGAVAGASPERWRMSERDELAEVAKDLARHARWARARGETTVPAVALPALDLRAVAPLPAVPGPSAPPAPPPAHPVAAAAPASIPVHRAPPAPPAPTHRAPPGSVRAPRAPPGPANGPGVLPPPPAPIPFPADAAPADRLVAIRTALGDCTRCKLCGGRKNLVFGVGNPEAELVFVGEGPGADEDLQGEPFVGKAGQLLTKMIEAMGYTRDSVYICNVVKCRPPGNRNPEPDEIAACEPYLRAQLDAIRPRAIVALGKFAAQTLLRDATPITRLRGHWRTYAGIDLMPTFHPAYLLRSPEEKRKAWDDLKAVLAKIGRKPPTRS